MPAHAGIHVLLAGLAKEDVDPGPPLRCGRDDGEPPPAYSLPLAARKASTRSRVGIGATAP